jgi:hypothetical protein
MVWGLSIPKEAFVLKKWPKWFYLERRVSKANDSFCELVAQVQTLTSAEKTRIYDWGQVK